MRLEVELPEALVEVLRHFTAMMGFKDMEEAILFLVREGLEARNILPIQPLDGSVDEKLGTFTFMLLGGGHEKQPKQAED